MGTRWASGSVALAAVLGLGAGLAAAPAGAQVQAPASVTATKTVTGTFAEGGTVTYVLTLTNSGGVASADNPGDELIDVFPAGLTLVSATASEGTTAIGVDSGTGLPQITWNGAFVVGSVTITITAQIQDGTEGDDLVNQADVHFDADATGTNESSLVTDADSTNATPDEPTVLHVAAFAPTVTIEQALVQPDPADSEPVRFTVEFSEPVSGFDGNDITRTGSAGATNALVTGAVPGTTFTVLVTGAVAPGTVIASIPADAAVDDDGNPSEASTSIDNQVTLTAIGVTTTSTTTGASTTSTLLAGTSTTVAAVAGTGSLPNTGSDEDGPLVAFLGYWLALGGVGFVGVAGWQRRRARAARS